MKPLFLKGERFDKRQGLLLELNAENGLNGLGEASPLYGFSSESVEQSFRELNRLSPSLIGHSLTKDWLSAEGALSRELDSQELSPSTRFAVELAVHNLYAKLQGLSLPELVCRSSVGSVPVNGLLSGPAEEVLEEGRRMRDAGYETVKLKVGRRGVEEDASLVLDLREVLGAEVNLRLDANRAWSFEEAVTFARATVDVRYEYIEEPLAVPSRLAELANGYGVPVALDESLLEMLPGELNRHRYAQAVVIKPTLVGGISRTLRLSKEAHRLGVTPVISSAYETGVGTEALVALAAATGNGAVAAGLDTYRQLAVDVLYPTLDLTAPWIDVPGTSTVGRELCRDYLHVRASSET